MYLKYDGTPVALSGPTNGIQLWDASSPPITINGSAGNDVLASSTGSTLAGGAGDDNYYLQSPSDTVVEAAGAGVDTVTTWMSYTLPDNVENLSVAGDFLYAAGNGLDNLIMAPSGNVQLYGGAGNDVLVGGTGIDTYIVNAHEGSDVIYGLKTASDAIRLANGMTSFAQVQAAMSQVGADVVIQIDPTETLTLRGVTTSQLTATNFELALDKSQLGPLTFDDEFSSLSLYNGTSGTWTPHFWYGGEGAFFLGGNGELQVYTAPGFTGSGTTDLGLNPFTISNGVLDIRTQPLTTAQSLASWGQQYSSGLLTTHDTFAQTYGYFEMKAELPTGAGFWPAFWLVPADGSWPPELDVMETLGGSPNIDYTTSHSGAGNSAIGSANLVTDPSGFHTYGVRWTPTTLTWYLDGQDVFQTATPSDMNKPMYMLVNDAVGGWAGAPSPTLTGDMLVDYVRVYSIPGVTTVQTGLPTPTDPGNGDTGGSTPPPPTSDTLTSDVTAILPAGVHTLVLSGTAVIDGTGAMDQGNNLIGNGAVNHLTGANWDDWFDGGAGNDILTGGGGSDTFGFSPGSGNDMITDWQPGYKIYAPGYTSSGALPTIAQVGADTLVSFDATDTVLLKNTVAGTIQHNGDWSLLYGVANTDVVSNIPDSSGVVGKTIFGGNGNKADKLTGTVGDDHIYGLGGNDTIDGKAGNDVLTGGSGGDTFIFRSGYGHDVITDLVASGANHNSIAIYGLGHQPAMQDVDEGALLTWSTGESLLILGDTVADITPSLHWM